MSCGKGARKDFTLGPDKALQYQKRIKRRVFLGLVEIWPGARRA